MWLILIFRQTDLQYLKTSEIVRKSKIVKKFERYKPKFWFTSFFNSLLKDKWWNKLIFCQNLVILTLNIMLMLVYKYVSYCSVCNILVTFPLKIVGIFKQNKQATQLEWLKFILWGMFHEHFLIIILIILYIQNLLKMYLRICLPKKVFSILSLSSLKVILSHIFLTNNYKSLRRSKHSSYCKSYLLDFYIS